MRGVEFASPQNFCVVDFGAVVDPLVVDVVIFGIVTDDDEMFSGHVRETILDDLPTDVTFACPPEGIAFAARDVSGGVEEEEQDCGAG